MTGTSSLRALSVALAGALLCPLSGTGCWSSYHPCPDDGVVEGSVWYQDGLFLDPQGVPYAEPGGSVLLECHEVLGDIILGGVLSDFSDFDNVESISGFFDNNMDLPTAGLTFEDLPVDLGICGLLSGFPNLRAIQRDQMWTSSSIDHSEGCTYWEGFESLEFVGGDFACRGTETVGQSLREVEGTLWCDNARLQNLERVGELALDGVPLPNLVWAGSLYTLSDRPETRFELPALVEVGDPASDGNEGLSLQGNTAWTLDLTSLAVVHGQLEVRGFFFVDLGVPEAERADEMRARLDHVEVLGRRSICRNGPDDPCPWEPGCADVHGEQSILCCNDDWPSCQASGP